MAGSDTSQIPSDVFFSYNKGVFTLYSVYFSVTFKKSMQKKVTQTTFVYKYDHLRSLVAIFFFFSLPLSRREHTGSDWLAPVLSVMHERQIDWLTHALPLEKFFNSCCKQSMKRNVREPNGAIIQFGKG